jgi:hypothetical protein
MFWIRLPVVVKDYAFQFTLQKLSTRGRLLLDRSFLTLSQRLCVRPRVGGIKFPFSLFVLFIHFYFPRL